MSRSIHPRQKWPWRLFHWAAATLGLALVARLHVSNNFSGRLLPLFCGGFFSKSRHDKKEQEKQTARLREQTQLLDLAYDSIMVWNLNNRLTFWNRAAVAMYGWSKEEALGQDVHRLLRTRFPEPLEAITARLMREGRWEGELVHIRRDGRAIILASRWAVQRDEAGRPLQVLEVTTDITSRKAAEQELHALLREKEILLREVHHRVKNNLQTIVNLLYMQGAYQADETVRQLFWETQSRVKSIALIHEKLYQSGSLAQLDFADYVRNLAGHLIAASAAGRVELKTKLEHLTLDVDTAVPLGIIINELISNSLKHAFPAGYFPNGRVNEINIGAGQEADGRLWLQVSDNGIGLPEAESLPRNSVGLQLVNLLVDHMKGTVELDNRSGTAYRITFTPLSPAFTPSSLDGATAVPGHPVERS